MIREEVNTLVLLHSKLHFCNKSYIFDFDYCRTYTAKMKRLAVDTNLDNDRSNHIFLNHANYTLCLLVWVFDWDNSY